MKKLFAAFTCVLTCLTLLHAGTPEERAEAYFNVLKSGNWSEAHQYFSPKAMEQFRDMMGFLDDLPEGSEDVIPALFGADATAESLQAMSNEEFFASMFSNMMSQLEAMGEVSFKDFTIIGSVPEGDDAVHVLARTKASVAEMEMERMEVLSFSRIGDSWGLMLQGEMKGMAQQMQQVFKMMHERQAMPPMMPMPVETEDHTSDAPEHD